MKMLKLSLLLCFTVILFVGCNRRPAELPELFPCRISVSNGDSKVADVMVLLVSQSTSGGWSSSGLTDTNGTAAISTVCYGWKDAGVPKGEYKVALVKEPVLEEISAEEYKNMSPSEQEEYSLKQQKKRESLPREIPVALSNIISTPLDFSVQENGENSMVIDIAEYSGKTKAKKR